MVGGAQAEVDGESEFLGSVLYSFTEVAFDLGLKPPRDPANQLHAAAGTRGLAVNQTTAASSRRS